VPERGPEKSVAPIVGGMFPAGVMGWWIRGARFTRSIEVENGNLITNVEITEKLIHAVVDAGGKRGDALDHNAARDLLEAVWLPAQIHLIEVRRPDWWPRAGAYPLAGRSPARWKTGKAVAGG